MKINIPFRRKDSEIETSPCVIDKTVELSADWFDHFSQNLLNDYDFILENIDHVSGQRWRKPLSVGAL